MEYLEYISAKKELSDEFYQIIEDENIQDITSLLKINNENDFKIILHLINNLSNYFYSKHHSKITHFILFNSDYIKQNFTNSEIFNIFQNNKRILLFLIEQKIIEVDFVISMLILTKEENHNFYIKYFSNFDLIIRKEANEYFNQTSSTFKSYIYYFFPEIKPFLVQDCVNQIQQTLKKHENFDINRKIGQNEMQLCGLIREDSIKEFIIYVTKNNLSLSMRIQKDHYKTLIASNAECAH